jgi:hypothetical protein
MYYSHDSRLFVSWLITGLAVVFSFAPAGPGQSPKKTPSELSLYHADPQHLWNRLHGALFVRVGPDGHAYGQDRLEPLLWLGSNHLLEGPSHNQAFAVLEEFVKNNGEKLVTDPLKRAMLQRDLWLLFNWVEIDHGKFGGPPPKVWQAAQARLRGPLATAVNRLALGPKEIQQLLDNYAAAVLAGKFAKQFDPKAPDKPYLPADLFAADGPWVCVGRPDGPIGPGHLRDWDAPNVFTNSTFLLFVRLPGGRAATLAYLKKLQSFDLPLMVKAKDDATAYVPNPKLPQFPVDTEVANCDRDYAETTPPHHRRC